MTVHRDRLHLHFKYLLPAQACSSNNTPRPATGGSRLRTSATGNDGLSLSKRDSDPYLRLAGAGSVERKYLELAHAGLI